MSRLYFATIQRLTPQLRQGNLAAVEQGVIEQMGLLPSSPFHIVLDLRISNDPALAAGHFDQFFRAEEKRFKVAAAYTEMNDFSINPDRWYCDLFAYAKDGGADDYDWLSDWQSERFSDYQINGLESLQEIYANEAFHDKSYREACYICDLLVTVKFQRFIQTAAEKMKELHFPLYATVHDSDFIAKIGSDGGLL